MVPNPGRIDCVVARDNSKTPMHLHYHSIRSRIIDRSKSKMNNPNRTQLVFEAKNIFNFDFDMGAKKTFKQIVNVPAKQQRSER